MLQQEKPDDYVVATGKTFTIKDFVNRAAKKIRLDIANRLISKKDLGNINYDVDGFPIGYGKNSQSVLIPAFISAYTGIDASKICLNPISDKPKLNWTLQYSGLDKYFDDIFSSVSLQHGYRSNFTLSLIHI